MVTIQQKENASEVRQHLANELQRLAPIFRAYLDCTEEMQNHARNMFEAMTDPESDSEDRLLSALTLAEILFPNLESRGNPNLELGLDLNELDTQEAVSHPEIRDTIEKMDQEESVFAKRLGDLMHKRQMSQARLAELIGVGQPAISMMLIRHCRPQKRTIEKLAHALNVTPEELWPIKA
ncbi:MAG: helix-turn-helix transcriptional regulator [Gemmataceae bacterium]